MEPVNIILVDDHPVVRAGYRRLIDSSPRLRVVAEADTSASAYRRILQGGVDVAVMDLNLPGAGGLEVIRRLRGRGAAVRVLVFSVHEEAVFVERALAAGATGYISKRCGADVMIPALLRTAAGHRYLSPGLDVVPTRSGIEPLGCLSGREFEVFRHIAEGASVREIASRLNLSGKTVANYNTQIRAKLGLGGTADLTRLAIASGVVHV